MKHLLLAVLSLLAISTLSAQSSPVYVLFKSECFQQLEYKRVRSGESIFAYSYRPNVDEQYIFFSVGTPLPTASLPEGTLDCSTLKITDDAVNIINDQTNARQIYVLIQQRTGGYMMMPITTAVQVKRYGSWYLLVGPKYTFAVDTANLSYQANLQSESSPSIIRFTGSQLANCLIQYKFHGEPTGSNKEIVDLDFIYGIGIVNLRRGANQSELQGSEMRLANVGGQTFDAYLTQVCGQPDQNAGKTTSTWTTTDAREPGKEELSSGGMTTQGNQIVTGSGVGAGTAAQSSSGCPTPYGKGYHIVQPGESLYAIARTYGVEASSLIKWNNIKKADHLEVCQQIWLQKPPAAGATAKNMTIPKNPKGTTVPNQSIYWGGTQQVAKTVQAGNVVGTHLIQQGETLSGIARRYNCSEACIRQANNLPPQGNVIIKTGQTLNIPQCPCQLNAGQSNATPSATRQPTTPTTPQQVTSFLNDQTQPAAPTAGYQKENPAYNQQQPSNSAQTQGNQSEQKELPPTQEYIVRQGETMSSIAIKHKMSVAELAALNGYAQDEKLVAGRRIIVRNYGGN